MTITIDPFWAGVICTILAEIITLVVASLVYGAKTRRKLPNSSGGDGNE